MRELREVLRLRYELNLGYQQIGRSCAIGVGTVHKYLKRAEAVGLTWPLPDGWDEARVESALSPQTGKPLAKTAATPRQKNHPQHRRASVDFSSYYGLTTKVLDRPEP
jgi:hypothetical protein